AGGRTSELTSEMVKTCQSFIGIETCMHLTCTNMPKEKVDIALREAKAHGCRNVLALRGDPPAGKEEWEAIEGGFVHGIDLVKHIRRNYGDYFDIAVAGFPQHMLLPPDELEQEMIWLKEKIDAGCNFIFTQMFYDVETFIKWYHCVREHGITIPIVPGIAPIQTWNGFMRATSLAKTVIPQTFLDALEPVKNDDEQVRKIGTKLVAGMCRRILDESLGIRGLHFYTMNLEKATKMLLEELNSGNDQAFALASSTTLFFTLNFSVLMVTKQSLTPSRRAETIRPIFWANRTKSYLSRTENWDEYPNGRFGDSRSPAYGELDGYGVWIKQTLGFLTINSQPAVNGARSDDKIFGWGPANGYIYQKAYLEFFVSPTLLDLLIPHIERDSNITYYVINKQGDLRTNTHSDGPNAVTWGVFPGKEIIQPTIVEAISFMAWKDEAYELGKQWASMYDADSLSYKVISDLMENSLLVNVVHNDFHDTEAIFKPFFKAGAEFISKSKPLVNGH
ncbi:Methylenetetrahydrofolate reductase 2, partial [Leucoagaricus sp. SymC.cos]